MHRIHFYFQAEQKKMVKKIVRNVLKHKYKIHQLKVRITKVHVLCTMVYIRVGATLTDRDAQLTQDKRPRFFKISKKGFSKR